jgi:hypothetical protein
VGENWVVRQGTIGLFGGEQYGCFPAAQMVVINCYYYILIYMIDFDWIKLVM